MKRTNHWIVLFALLLTTFTACKKDPDSAVTRPEPPELTQARFSDFQLTETIYSNIKITHPVLSNGVETAQGEIRVTIPRGSTQLQLTPKAANMGNGSFTVSPKLGTKQDFLSRVVLYTIAAANAPSKQVHYVVTVEEEQTPQSGQTALTSFRFEQAKNPSLTADITASKSIEGNGSIGQVFIFVPEGTAFTSLKPTIGFQGAGLYYTQDPAATPAGTTDIYPAAGLSIDFSYPKVFYAVVKNGNTIKTYNVIVDVKSPLRFDQPAVTTPNVSAGSSHYVETTSLLNRGNHPVTLAPVTHSDALPAGSSAALRGSGVIPSGGLKPGERCKVYTSISAQYFPAGNYQITASFKPTLAAYPAVDDLLEAAPLRISTTIVP